MAIHALDVNMPADFGQVGFIGVGDMGGPMADNLVAAGFQVTVYDTRNEALARARSKGAHVAVSLVDLVQRCSTIGICVWSDEQLFSVVTGDNGLLSSKVRDVTLLVHSTVKPQTIERLASACIEWGWSVLDAPVSKVRPASSEAPLTLMVGGDKRVFDRCAPYFRAVGGNIFHVGSRPGMGEVAKLCNNLMMLCNAFAVLEAMKLGAAYGVEEDVVRKIAAVSSGASWCTENWGFFDDLIQRHPQPDLFSKDLWEAVFAGKEQGLQLVLAGMVALNAPRMTNERLVEVEEGAPRNARKVLQMDRWRHGKGQRPGLGVHE